MKFKNIDLLDKKIESIIDFRVKSYYSDWKKYDRLKYMTKKAQQIDRKKDYYLLQGHVGLIFSVKKNLKIIILLLPALIIISIKKDILVGFITLILIL